MAIKITVGDEAVKAEPIKIDLHISKLLNNDYYISDHSLIDIIVQRENKKILAIAKNELDDQVYDVQHRLFDYLSKKGIVDQASIQGGNIYGSIEAKMLGSDSDVSEQASLLALKNFLLEEKPLEETERDVERELEMKLLLPDEEESTELGEIPHEDTKGTLQVTSQGFLGGAYFFETKTNKYKNKKEK